LSSLGLHLSHMHPMGLLRVTQFELLCRARGIQPLAERFHVCYKVTFRDSWFSFSRRKNVLPIAKDPPVSFHDWWEKFFFLMKRLLPAGMTLRGSALPKDPVLPPYEQEDWYKQLTKRPGPLKVIDEGALVAVGMMRVWERHDWVPIWTVNGVSKFLPYLT
ncbi:MAG: hypothetical protein Q8755_02750, partial [Candidatus Phytoplasma australasiaticum]|nr:hypothetical protein [Candidatus Phytoplasma australasiaticum]